MRRLVDIVVVVLAGVLLAPVMLIVALLILATMGRPVLFYQRRSGLHGSEFSIVKFRTMAPRTHPDQVDADRQTRMGSVLRSLSLDELPQLWNILVGHMSLIGPRPTLPAQVAHYSPRQRGRLRIRPGLTGWAQVRGRNSLSWPERIELDLWYVERRSLLLDLKIFGMTVMNLLWPRGVLGENGVNPDFPMPSAAEMNEIPGWMAAEKTQPMRAVTDAPRSRRADLVDLRQQSHR